MNIYAVSAAEEGFLKGGGKISLCEAQNKKR